MPPPRSQAQKQPPLIQKAIALLNEGKAADSERICTSLLKTMPGNLDALYILGVVRLRQGRPQDAIDLMVRVLDKKPAHVELMLNLTRAYSAVGRFADALAVSDRAAAAQPQSFDAHFMRATALRGLKRFEECIPVYDRVIALRPDHLQSFVNRGNTLQDLGRYADAVTSYDGALALRPDLVPAWNGRGNALKTIKQYSAAIESYDRALALQPAAFDVLNNRGLALAGLGNVDEAIATFRRLAELDPRNEAAWGNLAAMFRMQGDIADALHAYRQLMALDAARSATAHRGLLTTLLYDPSMSAEQRWQEHAAFGQKMAALVTQPLPPLARDRTPDRRLRIGYVTSDLRGHPVARNLEPIVSDRDRAGFEVFIYSNVETTDAVTVRFKGMADGWRDINDLTDAQVAQQIRADSIDILVLLAGHFDSNRPQLAAWRAAPVQVSFHDPATSGVAEMDYIILDPTLAPRYGPEKFSERVARLPSFYLHPPIIDAPAIGAVPATTRGHITFGSLNSPSKINVPVLRLWSRVLRAVPGSRLKLKFKNAFANDSLQKRILRDLDVDPARVEWDTGEVSTAEHLALYNGIDIALDPFPFTGSTTTFEALWMGVPVVTLTTPAPAGRWSASILRTLGQPELIAGTEDDYVRIATSLAGDLPRLAAYRQSFRDRMAASPLCNGPARTRQVERLYRAMWRRWCKAPD